MFLLPPSFYSRILPIRLPLIDFISDGKLHDRIVAREMGLVHVDA